MVMVFVFQAIFNYAQSLSSGSKVFTSTAGNIVALSAPQLKFSSVDVSEDSGIFKYDTQFSLEPIAGDDEAYIAFL